MTSTGPQRSLCLLCALLLAGAIAIIPGCNGGESEDTNSDGSSAQSDGQSASNGSGTPAADPTADVDSEPLRVVLAFQAAVIDLDFERAMTMVDETTPAYQSVRTASETMRILEENPNIPDAERGLAMAAARGGWVGATAEEAANEGGSAIIAVTRSNGTVVDVNLTFFQDQWQIVSPDDAIQLR